MGAQVFIDSGTAIEQVRSTLKGPVLQLLAAGLPEVKRLPAQKGYDLILGDLGLLEKSFAYFRTHRDQFKAVLVAAEAHPVEEDSTPLSCGRSLDEVVAMIVRSAAYRYFAAKLDGAAALAAPVAPARSLAGFLPVLTGRAKEPGRSRRSRAQALYHAIREYLLYEWQVPLVPAYSQLTPQEVIKLGPRLTDLRSPEALRVASGHRPQAAARKPGDRPEPVVARVPAPAPPAAEPRLDLASLLTEDGARLWVETLGRALQDPEVIRAADNGEQPAHIKAALKAVGRDLLRCLVEDIGFDKKQLAVCLVRAQAVLPRMAFEQMVRSSINAPALVKLVAMAKRQHIGPNSTLPDCARFITQHFAPPPPAADGGAVAARVKENA